MISLCHLCDPQEFWLSLSLECFLDELARRGSWLGGGSVAALSAALSAALLEKLTVQPIERQRVRRIRRRCAALVTKDATVFAHVIRTLRGGSSQAFRRSLKAATAVQQDVLTHADAVITMCRKARRTVKPRFQSDLQCAQALAEAARYASKKLIGTNRAWLNDAARPAKTSKTLCAC
ncbi:MAG: cyclodeaminase/cyclohydrolase family protein [Candidatus Omnitrophica bacterium]|nr:cyclodeaminase/cyclohydrolase family protein [Candidatus Omnitrophota bacterium]